MASPPNVERKRIILSWSSGKDSAWTLHKLQEDPSCEVVALLTTFNAAACRVSMHEVRRQLVLAQSASIGLPMQCVDLPWPCSNADYARLMGGAIDDARARFDVGHVAFGDLFLEDVRQYREARLADTALSPLFPLWGLNTKELAMQMIRDDLRAVVVCLDPKMIPQTLAGKRFDQDFLDSLPKHVDPCGENGEFHTFVYDGSMFHEPISIDLGKTVERDGLIYTDIMSA